ncbi:hypothetical protein BDP55DRAFT_731589 [Colletotrichum godetiae]|uniref:Uncharacterized protein n=1 Tax=Colletotrichum godetiae TaxID=1209918 RepID=A0AAJ0AEG4_9PEZI|nr:uncharacterized protein BDP55DRAFT_731589 [Colletotrichum godetiae]KAK1672360.1 hypothetical protein BDP55DRAFT_731589 [Colletotrichum godetiae]
MRFSTAFTLLAATLAVAAPAPADLQADGDKGKGKKEGGAIAACETQTAADHVKCIDACGAAKSVLMRRADQGLGDKGDKGKGGKDKGCILDCTSKAVAGYTGCAGVGPGPVPTKPN